MGTVMTTILIATDLVVTMLVPRLPLQLLPLLIASPQLPSLQLQPQLLRLQLLRRLQQLLPEEEEGIETVRRPLLRLLLLRLLPLPRLRRLLRPLLLRQLLPVLLLLQRSRQLNSNVVTVETVVAVVEDELSMKRHLLFSFNGQLMLIKRF